MLLLFNKLFEDCFDEEKSESNSEDDVSIVSRVEKLSIADSKFGVKPELLLSVGFVNFVVMFSCFFELVKIGDILFESNNWSWNETIGFLVFSCADFGNPAKILSNVIAFDGAVF